MNTDARRKASAAFVAKRKALGWRKVTLWLSPEALFKLDGMKASTGSKDKAAEAAILAYGGLAKIREGHTKPMTSAGTSKAKAVKPKIEPTTHVEVPVYAPKAFNPRPKVKK